MYTALGGDELIGLVDPRRENLQTENPKCDEGESEEPTGKDSNESVYEAERVEFGRARVSHSGTGAAAPEQRNRSRRTASNRGARTNISCIVNYFSVFFLNTGVVGCV
ncbi:unnamed protein product [Ectocarpus sp. CCAP 1310/34]|nr:unnamed protein product [Ectocarpus sp. CCAP 1310/34]